MNYKLLQKSPSEKTPIFLDAVLAETFDRSKPMPATNSLSTDYLWMRAKYGTKIDYPDTLFLISNQSGYLKFDYYWKFGGFIISEELKLLFEKYGTEEEYQTVPLNSIDAYGISNTNK